MDNFIHIGGDELNLQCWNSTAINQWMVQNNISTYNLLENYFEARALAISASLNRQSMVWQDPFNNGVQFAPGTVIEVWEGGDFGTLRAVLDAGYPAVMAGFWYLDHLGDAWDDFYVLDINQADLNFEEQQFVLGGEACMWGEMVDHNNWEPRVFPRASAVAEVLWSPGDIPKIPVWSAARLHQFKCRMNMRGINADPVGTQYGVNMCNPL